MSVSAIFTPVIGTREEEVKVAESVGTVEISKDNEKSEGEYPNLARVPCIRYPITFRKKSVSMSALLDSESEVNAIYPTFARKLGLPIRSTDVGAQKIDRIMLDTFAMVVSAFSVTDKANQLRFFEETFLVANISLEVVLEMPFFILSGADVNFAGRKLWWKTYTTKKILSTTKRVKLVGKKEFAVAALDPEHETYVVHVASLSSTPLASPNVHPFRRA